MFYFQIEKVRFCKISCNITNDELKLKRKTELIFNKENNNNQIKKFTEEINNCKIQKEMCNKKNNFENKLDVSKNYDKQSS